MHWTLYVIDTISAPKEQNNGKLIDSMSITDSSTEENIDNFIMSMIQ